LEESSPERDRWRHEVALHFRRAINKPVLPQSGGEHDEPASQVLALARADKFADENVVVDTVFRDPRLPVFFIEASRQKNPRPSCCSMFPPKGCEYSRRPTSAAVDGLRARDFQGSGLRAEHHAG
jgi:hypothetical protein